MLPLPLALLLLAAEPGGVCFHASYDLSLNADFAGGAKVPLKAVGGRLAKGRFGRALRLDGASYLEYAPAGNLGARGGTVAFWFRPAQWGDKTYDSLFGLSDTNDNGLQLERSHPGGQLRLVVGGPGTVSGAATRSLFSKAPLRDGQWVHVAATWDAATGTAELFCDGASQARTDGKGPVPVKPPAILVGCGFGRLARAATGLLDELVILDHAANAEEVKQLMAGPILERDELSTDTVTAVVDRAHGAVTVALSNADGDVSVGPGAPYARLGEREVTWPAWQALGTAPATFTRLGEARHSVYGATDAATGLELRYHLEVPTGTTMALLWMELKNTAQTPVTLTRGGLFRAAAPALGLPHEPRRVRVFCDSGGLTGSGVRELVTPNASHAGQGALVLADPERPWAASCSFVSFREAWPTATLTTDAQGAPAGFDASCGLGAGRTLAPGETWRSEVLAVSQHPSGWAALTGWADTVMAVNDFQPPRFCPAGWNSWYCYRLTITEDLVLQNAKVMRERFGAYGLDTVQIDHGWQDRDLVGNWVPNTRFPHGLNWLSQQLQAQGQKLGLWTAVSLVSEFAPQLEDHPEMLVQDPKGGPFVAGDRWYWEPHGKVYSLDPTEPAGEALYRHWGEAVRGYGCAYTKNDFVGNLLSGGIYHDASRGTGVPIFRRAIAAYRAGLGPDMPLQICSGTPLNVAAGLCDAVWTHEDIGNPAGNWDHLRGFANDFSCRAHVTGKFYWSDPDYLQVGQGTLDEARVRMAFAVLGAGPMFLSDRLPELPEEKLALIEQCLPSYGRPAVPLDLFSHPGYPRVWSLPVQTAWGARTVVGLFNLDAEPASLPVRLDQLGLPDAPSYLVWDAFAHKLLGEVPAPAPGDDALRLSLELPVAAHTVRLIQVVPKLDHPFVLSTDMHLTGGGVELPEVKWADDTLSGVARRRPGARGRVFVYVPAGYTTEAGAGPVVAIPVTFAGRDQAWSVRFAKR